MNLILCGEYFCRTYALPVKIGNGSWLGGEVIELPGVSIGNSSVIGAGSVVTKDIPENVAAEGNPCRMNRLVSEKSSSLYRYIARGIRHIPQAVLLVMPMSVACHAARCPQGLSAGKERRLYPGYLFFSP